MRPLTFVTQSANKILEAERSLGASLVLRRLELPEIQAIDVEDVVQHKARIATKLLGQGPVMVEDTRGFARSGPRAMLGPPTFPGW